ncbi:hypothetical protein D0868_15009 [Hortaea werneckii]|uniref:Mitochondrial ATPase complex subunit ATP10 n=1 Tax=Hortaea werneckii TaxID=91943 RepID=A0A3M6X8R5_HORWE|nr:hypothetical protein D0868_15009 [Hortaea werneckii]
MKAPSPLTLRALRALVYTDLPTSSRQCLINHTQRHSYASQTPAKRQQQRTSKPPPPPNPSKPAPPPPVFRPTPSGPDLRKKRDDDEDFTPYPLSRPIGMPNPPQPGENIGLDTRAWREKRDDFHNYEKHLERRARMTKQIAKPYFRDWSNMRFHKGKRAERLQSGDGYGGLGRDTCEAMAGKVSVVSLGGNEWADRQVATWTKENPELDAVLKENGDVAQRVCISYEENWAKWHILNLFGAGNLRKGLSLEEQRRFFLVRRGLSEIMKEAIGLLNDKGGYVYLVDQECRIRWAGSAEAEDREKEWMVRGLKKLCQEARVPREKRVDFFEREEKLEAAVDDVMEDHVAESTNEGAKA